MFAAVLREHGFSDAKRGQQFHGGPDSADVVGLPGHHVEVKFTDKLRIQDAMAQAVCDSGPGEMPLVAFKQTGEPWLAITPMDDYLLLVRELIALRNSN